MKFNIILFIFILLITGCSYKSTKLPENVSKLQNITSLNQFDGCYLPNKNEYIITNILANTSPNYFTRKYRNRIKKTYKICLKSLDNELIVTIHEKNGILLAKRRHKLGKEISISFNALVFDSEYNIIKASDAGALIGPQYKRKYLTLNTDNDLIFSDNSFATGIAILMFLPLPVFHSNQYSTLLKRVE